ncbi:hypothetical protein GCM10027294_24980 [Marinactinospora endophytica]
MPSDHWKDRSEQETVTPDVVDSVMVILAFEVSQVTSCASTTRWSAVRRRRPSGKKDGSCTEVASTRATGD